MVLADTGVVFDCSWGFKGCQEGPFFESWGTLGRPFRALGVALGADFGGQGVPLVPFGPQSLHEIPPFFPLASF